MIIVGAGLAGLLAAHAWPTASIVEASPGPTLNHAALLRFRTDIVSRLAGIEFRKVRVHKGIWFDDRFNAPNIQLANLYSSKVLGTLMERSVWDIEPVDRWIAPESFYEELIESVGKRVVWGEEFDWGGTVGTDVTTQSIINTAPLPVLVKQFGFDPKGTLAFARAPITVQRFRLMRSDVFQTVYFPTV